MTISVQFYKNGKLYFGAGSINLNTADIRAIPLTSSYTFNQAHDFANDLTNEVTTNGGSRLALTGESWALSGNNALFDCDDLAWTASGGDLTIRHVALVDYTGSSGDSDRELLALISSSVDLTAGNGTQVKLLTASGLFEIQ